MSFTINTNIAAMSILYNLSNSQNSLQKVSDQLSSGYQINSAADDAAGLAIATKMGNQVTGLKRATQNAQDGLSMLQTMEGGIASITDMFSRMRDLALQAANATATQSDRSQMVTEMKQLQQEINRTAAQTQFNTQNLLTGLGSKGIAFQVGANANQTISLKANNANLLSGGNGISAAFINNICKATTIASGVSQANILVSQLDKTLSQISKFRANVGAVEDRLNYAINNLGSESNNLSTAQSRIMDTNMAAAMTQFSKNQILVNAGISMLAQANQMPGAVLKLLG